MKWQSTPIAMMLLMATTFHTTGAADLPRGFEVGDTVEARWKNLGGWYRATISELNDDGSYLITWADGQSEDRIKRDYAIRQPKQVVSADPVTELRTFKIGDEVDALYYNGRRYLDTRFGATISGFYNDGSYLLTWRDGDKEDRIKTASEIHPGCNIPVRARLAAMHDELAQVNEELAREKQADAPRARAVADVPRALEAANADLERADKAYLQMMSEYTSALSEGAHPTVTAQLKRDVEAKEQLREVARRNLREARN